MINIYWDVDGNINALSKGSPRQNTQWFGNWNLEKVEGFPILWSAELIEEIKVLDSREDVANIWLTTWEHLAPKSLAPVIGVGHDWPVLAATDELAHQDINNWWKFALIQEHIAETNPDKIIWLDDDLQYVRDAVEWSTSQNNLLAISPNPNFGLRKKDISAIMDFIN